VLDDQFVRIEDLGSSNGTFHNGEKVQDAQLAPGDTVQIGPVTFLVQIDGVPADDQLQPAAPGDAADNLDFSDTDHADEKSAAQMAPPGEPEEPDYLNDENMEDVVDLNMEEQASPDDSGN
jgi:pSer/pThr/pTyr-binding forkhead associated (FHA) protein